MYKTLEKQCQYNGTILYHLYISFLHGLLLAISSCISLQNTGLFAEDRPEIQQELRRGEVLRKLTETVSLQSTERPLIIEQNGTWLKELSLSL